MSPRLLTCSLLLLAACTPNSGEWANMSSSTLARTASGDGVVVANADEGTVSLVSADVGLISELDLGGEPVRVARYEDLVYVSDRAQRSVVVIRIGAGDSLSEVNRFPVGAEPYGVVVSDDGNDLWVAVSQQDEVVRIDTRTGDIQERVSVPGEPRWLALHTSGKLFVGSARGGQLHLVDSGALRHIELPEQFSMMTGMPMSPRITGDIALAPDGRGLAVPTFYSDTETPLDDPEMMGFEEEGGGYGGMGRNEPGVVIVPVDPGGDPGNGGGVVLGIRSNVDFVATYPTSVTYSPDGDFVAVTQEANDVVAVVPTDSPPQMRTGPFAEAPEMAYWVRIGTGARGLAWGGGRLFAQQFTSGRVHVARVADLAPRGSQMSGDEIMSTGVGYPSTHIELPADVVRGRAMFFSSVDERMAGAGAGVSCSTCHFDGRSDGVTWPFMDMPRQTPSLAGRVSETAPFTWRDDVPTVALEAQLTSEERMGGFGLSESEAADVAAYIDWSRPADHPRRGEVSNQVTLGRTLFEREDVGCATCHDPDGVFTDGELHDVTGNGVATRTPSLRGVAASAPYMSDGSQPSLRAVLAFGADGRMGDVSGLDASEIDALLAYVESL